MRAHFEQHELPNGVVVWYRHTKANGEEDHSYWRGAEPVRKTKPDDAWKGCGQLTGVSTVASPFDFRPDALMRWAARTNGIGVSMLAETALASVEAGHQSTEEAFDWLRSHETIWRRLEDEALTFSDVRDQRADEGTNVHKHALHELARGNAVPRYEKLSDDERGYANGVMDFWIEHMPVTLQAEAVVADFDRGIAGRLDWRGHFREKCGRSWCACAQLIDLDTSIVVLDGKTSGFIPLKHHVQVRGYDALAIESQLDGESSVGKLGGSDLAAILQVNESGGWELIPVLAAVEDFDSAIDTYRRAGKLMSALNANAKLRHDARSA